MKIPMIHELGYSRESSTCLPTVELHNLDLGFSIGQFFLQNYYFFALIILAYHGNKIYYSPKRKTCENCHRQSL